MRSRLFFLLVTGFWVVMNYLLWASQGGGSKGFGNSIPAETVWEKILNAPDRSNLEVYDRDDQIGFAHWGAGAADSKAIGGRMLSQDYKPDSQARTPTGFTLSFDGSVILQQTNRIGFQTTLILNADRTWKEFRLRATVRRGTWIITANVADQNVTIREEDSDGSWERTLKFSELEDPQTLLGTPEDSAVLSLIGVNKNLFARNGPDLHWDAWEDRMKVSRSELRVFRLDANFLGRNVEVLVSRAGEILSVKLPNNISLRNQVFSSGNTR